MLTHVSYMRLSYTCTYHIRIYRDSVAPFASGKNNKQDDHHHIRTIYLHFITRLFVAVVNALSAVKREVLLKE